MRRVPPVERCFLITIGGSSQPQGTDLVCTQIELLLGTKGFLDLRVKVARKLAARSQTAWATGLLR
jgi:hypothetical protein